MENRTSLDLLELYDFRNNGNNGNNGNSGNVPWARFYREIRPKLCYDREGAPYGITYEPPSHRFCIMLKYYFVVLDRSRRAERIILPEQFECIIKAVIRLLGLDKKRPEELANTEHPIEMSALVGILIRCVPLDLVLFFVCGMMKGLD
jgi:hypothetical protein